MDAEIASVKELNANTDAYARGISAWIKDTLGTKLEILDQKIAEGIESRQKASEASMWAIFSAKLGEASAQFDSYRLAMDQKHKELEEQFLKMRDELKKSNALRAKAEQSVKHLEDTFARLTRERADEEAQLFRKLTMKLEDERRAIEDERRKMADERKKYKHLLEKHKFEVEKSTITTATTPAAAPSAPISIIVEHPAVPVIKPSHVVKLLPDPTKPQYSSMSQWLKEIGFEEYIPVFSAFGYESLHLVQLLDDGDLDIMSISKPGHRKALISAAADLANAILVKDPSNDPLSSSSSSEPSSISSKTTNAKASSSSNPNAKRPLPKMSKAVFAIEN
jgi:hypothetical protein